MFVAHEAVTPAGKPVVVVFIPVAPVVVCVIDGDIAVFTQSVVVFPAVTVFVGFTTTIVVAGVLGHPPTVATTE